MSGGSANLAVVEYPVPHAAPQVELKSTEEAAAETCGMGVCVQDVFGARRRHLGHLGIYPRRQSGIVESKFTFMLHYSLRRRRTEDLSVVTVISVYAFSFILNITILHSARMISGLYASRHLTALDVQVGLPFESERTTTCGKGSMHYALMSRRRSTLGETDTNIYHIRIAD